MENYEAMFRGDYSCLPRKESNIVRIFLSSTFGGTLLAESLVAAPPSLAADIAAG